MKVLELRGPRTLGPLNIFSALMLGLKMLPAYMGESYEDFLTRLSLMTKENQEKMIREALSFVELKPEEIERALCFCCDTNGVPYGPTNIKNLNLKDILEGLVLVCMEVVQIAVDFISDSEKKKSLDSQSISDVSLQSTLQ